MTGIESYVYELYGMYDNNWLPRNQALVLNQLENEEEDGEDDLQKCVANLQNYSKKMDEFNARLASLTLLAAK